MKKIVIVNDYHIPFEDNKTLKSFYNMLKDFKPDELIINGDFLDFYDMSNFDKELINEGVLQEELDTGFALLKSYRKLLPKSRIVMTISNHMEKRLERFKKSIGRAVYSLRYFTIPQMLRLDELDIEHMYQVEYKKFIVYHGDIVRKHSAYTAKAVLENKGKSVFMGHVHRLGSHYKTNEGGEHVGVECGCMCNLNPEYIDGKPNWQQGFAVIYEDEKTGWFQHYLVPIIDHKFIWDGKWYK